MGRIETIETIASSGLPHYCNLKVIVRGKPHYVDPQMDSGTLRFSIKRGFNFAAILPENQVEIVQDAYKDSQTIVVRSRPSFIGINTLIRLGGSEAIGELHIVRDVFDTGGIETFTPILNNHLAAKDQNIVPVVSLIGTPCYVYVESPDNTRVIKMDSWYQIVPKDSLFLSLSPDVLYSYKEYEIKRADLIGTRSGNAGIGEPSTVYLYNIELNTKTGLLPFVPEVGMRLFLKASPLFYRGDWGTGNIPLAGDLGPCLLDAFYGSVLNNNSIDTKLGIKTWDAFGQQINTPDNQQWEVIPENYLLLERPIISDSLLFWQRITGNFQYQKRGYFQAELNNDGKFCFSSNLLVPKWPTHKRYGWVIPMFSRSSFKCIFQYEPQPPQIFEVPSNTLTFIRPHVEVGGAPIDRIIMSFKGSPNSRVEVRDWQYNGTSVASISYYMLGTKEAYGQKRWLAGGFCVKPLFYNLSVLRARYSDGVSRYNAGHIYI